MERCKNLAVYLYKITADFPDTERFGLINQVRRAAVSIPANIAEGSARISEKDKAHFYTMAFGSAMEVLNHLIIAEELGFMQNGSFQESRAMIETITFKINALKKALTTKTS